MSTTLSAFDRILILNHNGRRSIVLEGTAPGQGDGVRRFEEKIGSIRKGL